MIHPSTIHLLVAAIAALALLLLGLSLVIPRANGLRELPCTSRMQDDEGKLSSLASRVPISEIRDGLVVRRDGSFCAAWEAVGCYAEFAPAERLEEISNSLDTLLRGVQHPGVELQVRYVIDSENSASLDERQAATKCVNSASTWLEDNRLSFWKSAIEAGQLRSIRLLILISWKPPAIWETRSAFSRFANTFWTGLVQQGLSLKVLRRAVENAQAKALVQRNRAEHRWCVAEFEQVLEPYRIGLEAITPIRRLTEAELFGLLYSALNPRHDASGITRNGKLEGLLNTDWSEGLRLVDIGGCLKAVVTLSELPEATFASLTRPLAGLDFPCELVVTLRVPDQAKKIRKLRCLLKKSLAFQLRKDGSRRRDFQSAAVEKDTVETLTSAITSSQKLVELEYAVVVTTSRAARTVSYTHLTLPTICSV